MTVCMIKKREKEKKQLGNKKRKRKRRGRGRKEKKKRLGKGRKEEKDEREMRYVIDIFRKEIKEFSV